MSTGDSPSEPRTLRIAILGCGTAVLSGILKAIDTTTPHTLKFSLSAASQTTLDRLRHKFNSQRYRDHVDVITADNATAARDADVVVLAFQPHQLSQVLSDTVLVEILRPKLIISLLAGVSCRDILDKLSPGGGHGVSDESRAAESETSSSSAQTGQRAPPRIARAIPSIGAQINESASLLAGDTDLSASDHELVTWLFGLVGAMHVVPERLLNAVTAISAATHALAVVAVYAIVDGGVVSGVSRPVAMAVATQCLRSASTLMRARDEDGMTVEGLKEAMSIPRGITINAMLELERGRVRAGISDAATTHAHARTATRSRTCPLCRLPLQPTLFSIHHRHDIPHLRLDLLGHLLIRPSRPQQRHRLSSINPSPWRRKHCSRILDARHAADLAGSLRHSQQALQSQGLLPPSGHPQVINPTDTPGKHVPKRRHAAGTAPDEPAQQEIRLSTKDGEPVRAKRRRETRDLRDGPARQLDAHDVSTIPRDRGNHVGIQIQPARHAGEVVDNDRER
ncbi:hypothetical protein CLCR_05630 [Cladophialophora carrionii]|uniref:Pyrroline-5-carboxylate reductase n=1 Tax=Cladophialophora carrionii TaxID=86049 RepID=A0A1C1C835_9EURO|nr:hypothetical protein CLCR_05630 [Cladophialophora carrionii]